VQLSFIRHEELVSSVSVLTMAETICCRPRVVIVCTGYSLYSTKFNSLDCLLDCQWRVTDNHRQFTDYGF